MRVSKSFTAALVLVATISMSPVPALAVDIGSSVVHESTTNDLNDMYKLDGIKYKVYTDAACTTLAKDVNNHDAILTVVYDNTHKTAKTNTLELKPGTYYVKEDPTSAQGKGFAVDSEVHQAVVTANHTETAPLTVQSTEKVVHDDKGNIEKLDSQFGKVASGDGTLKGAVICVRYFDEIDTSHNAQWYKNNANRALRTWYFATDDNGEISIATAPRASGYTSDAFYMSGGKRRFLLGTYLMEEVKAPTGYDKPANGLVLSRLTQVGTSSDSPAGAIDADLVDEPTQQHVTIEKRDAEVVNNAQTTTGETVAAAKISYKTGDSAPAATTTQGDTDHASTYRVKNVSTHSISYVASNGNRTTVASGSNLPEDFTAKKDSSGKWVTPVINVTYGTYEITEISAGEGMVRDTTWKQTVVAHRDEAHQNDKYEFTQLNIPIRGGMGLVKVDSATEKSHYYISNGHNIATILQDTLAGQGDAHLDGAEFTIKNVSKNPVLVNGKWYNKNSDIATITTYVDGEGHVVAYTKTSVELPYGTYEVRETKAPEGYHPIEGLIGGGKLVIHPTEAQAGSWYFTGWSH